MRVDIYWNLHEHCYSLRSLEGTSRGIVIAHANAFVMTDGVRLVVQPAGRDKVRREGKKNVHAFVRGTLGVCRIGETWVSSLIPDAPAVNTNIWPLDPVTWKGFGFPITYNPFKDDGFIEKETTLFGGDRRVPIQGCDAVAGFTVNGKRPALFGANL